MFQQPRNDEYNRSGKEMTTPAYRESLMVSINASPGWNALIILRAPRPVPSASTAPLEYRASARSLTAVEGLPSLMKTCFLSSGSGCAPRRTRAASVKSAWDGETWRRNNARWEAPRLVMAVAISLALPQASRPIPAGRWDSSNISHTWLTGRLRMSIRLDANPAHRIVLTVRHRAILSNMVRRSSRCSRKGFSSSSLLICHFSRRRNMCFKKNTALNEA